MLLDKFLEDTALRNPQKTALICGTQRVGYDEINRHVNSIARGFRALGLKPGDRVCLHLENSVEVVLGAFAAMRAGGVFLIVNPGVKGDKLSYILNDCNARILITDSRKLQSAEREIASGSDLRHIVLVDGDGHTDKFKVVKHSGIAVHGFQQLVAAHSQEPLENSSIDLDLASLIYTSGSTGSPKGVMLTHLNMVTAVNSITKYVQNEPDDIILNCLPLAFDYGLYQVLMAFKFGGTVVLEKKFLYAGHYLNLIRNEKVTGLPMVPAILAILLGLKDLSASDLSTVRYMTNTAQALPVAHIQRLRQLLPQARIYSMYGLTECKRVSYLPPQHIDSKPESVGIAIPNTETWLESQDGSRITTPWTPGELVVRGAHVMAGYWNKPEETAKYLKPGRYPGERILKTGDLFQQDEDGYLYFISRMDDLIKTAGERVGPREIENVIYELEPVREAAVIGVPDPILGNAIKAFIVLHENTELTADEVVKHCLKRLEPFMTPKYVDFRDELPKTNTGKISKKELALTPHISDSRADGTSLNATLAAK